MAVELDDRAGDRSAVDPKAVVRRLIEHVINAGRLDLIEKLHAPAMAAAARHWIAPFLESSPDVQMDILELIAAARLRWATALARRSRLRVVA